MALRFARSCCSAAVSQSALARSRRTDVVWRCSAARRTCATKMPVSLSFSSGVVWSSSSSVCRLLFRLASELKMVRFSLLGRALSGGALSTIGRVPPALVAVDTRSDDPAGGRTSGGGTIRAPLLRCCCARDELDDDDVDVDDDGDAAATRPEELRSDDGCFGRS